MTNFVYMCRSVDAAILQYRRVKKICQQAELDSIELLQHCVYPEWTGLLPAVDTAGVVS